MKLTQRSLITETDYFHVRNFLRKVFLLNNRLEHSWNVARLDYWRWHFIATCQFTPPFEQVTTAWETEDGELAAVLHPFGNGEIRLHIHPHFRSPDLEDEIFACAEQYCSEQMQNRKYIIAPIFTDDALRQEVLTQRGFTKRSGWNHHYWRDLTVPLPATLTPAGYQIRSMGDESEHPSHSLCSC